MQAVLLIIFIGYFVNTMQNFYKEISPPMRMIIILLQIFLTIRLLTNTGIIYMDKTKDISNDSEVDQLYYVKGIY